MASGRKVWLLAMLAVALVAACGWTDESVAPEKRLTTERTVDTERSGVATRFVGTEWKLTLLHGQELLEGTSTTLEIDREAGRVEVGGTATCNFYDLWKPTVKAGVLKTRGIGSTEIGCTGDRGRQETAYFDALSNAAAYRLRGDTLEVQNSGGTATLEYEQEALSASDPAGLIGTRWVLRSIGGMSIAEGFTTSVSFDSEHKLSGYDGCRHFTGRYYANENDLTVPDFGYEVGEDCLKPGAYGGVDSARALENMPLEGNYALSKTRLEVRDDSGAVSVYEPLRESADVEEPGPAWVLEEFVEDNEATTVLDGTEITLKFDKGTLRRSGRMGGNAGCNVYSIPYEYPLAGNSLDRIDVSSPSITKKTCPFPSGVMQQERRYLDILADVGSYPSISRDGRMRLDTTDGRALVFSPPG